MVTPPEPAAPNFQAFNNAINGMTTEATNMSASIQTYTQHQQIVGQQLQLIGNLPQNAVLQNLVNAVNNLSAQMDNGFARLEARINNQDVKFQNSRIFQSTAPLHVPCSLDPSPNAQVTVGTPIPNFPQNAAVLMEMNVQECHRILRALNIPVQANQGINELQMMIRKAIGLPAL